MRDSPRVSPLRVLVAKTGLDGHDRGIKLVASRLRDLGMEVVYLGTLQTLERIVHTSRDEDVHVVGLSCHAGEHVDATRDLRAALDAEGLGDVRVVIGGVFPVHDIEAIKEAGADLVFRVGTDFELMASDIQGLFNRHRTAVSFDG